MTADDVVSVNLVLSVVLLVLGGAVVHGGEGDDETWGVGCGMAGAAVAFAIVTFVVYLIDHVTVTVS